MCHFYCWGNQQVIYPNPFENIFTIEIDLIQHGEIHFTLTDLEGKLVKNLLITEASAGKNQFKFSTQPLSNGIYFLNIFFEGEILSTNKIIKE